MIGDYLPRDRAAISPVASAAADQGCACLPSRTFGRQVPCPVRFNFNYCGQAGLPDISPEVKEYNRETEYSLQARASAEKYFFADLIVVKTEQSYTMKKLLTLPVFILFLSATHAQKVDLDRFNFTVSYHDFPEELLPQAYKTYNIRLETSPSLGLGYSSTSLTNTILIEGLRKVEGTGHITILLMLDDIVFDKPETIERVQTSKDKQGIEVKKSMFSLEFLYSFAARMSVYDYKGNTIVSNRVLFDRDNKRTYKTPEANSTMEAANYYNNKISDIRSTLAKQLAATVITQTNQWLNERYGFPTRRANDILWILNNKRHNVYSAHQKAWNDFKNAIVLMNENEPLDKVKQKMQPVIDYFENVKKQYTSSDKEDKKMRYASYYNLAKIYIYLDEPEKAMTEADALAMNDYDEKDGKILRSTAELLANTLRKNNTGTRHFAVNSDKYEPPIK